MGHLEILELSIARLTMFVSGRVCVLPEPPICPRVGFSPWTRLLALLPVPNDAPLWRVAFAVRPAFPVR